MVAGTSFEGPPPAAVPTAEPVSAAAVCLLRTRILRPTWADRLATYPEDDAPGTVHLASRRGGEVVGVGTIYPEAPPEVHRGDIPDAAYAPGAAYRLRGMATDPAVRGAGYGAAVLQACFDTVRQSGAGYLWCNARLLAVPFYERLGMACVGPEFDIPEIGPHYVMWRAV